MASPNLASVDCATSGSTARLSAVDALKTQGRGCRGEQAPAVVLGLQIVQHQLKLTENMTRKPRIATAIDQSRPEEISAINILVTCPGTPWLDWTRHKERPQRHGSP